MSGDQIASALQSFLHNKETKTEAAIEATLLNRRSLGDHASSQFTLVIYTKANR